MIELTDERLVDLVAGEAEAVQITIYLKAYRLNRQAVDWSSISAAFT
ncbi:hypothetical protein PY650_09615 [Rhizobium calliandrae]|uniref:Uncharacterized protein n=1 Tax=Rhizobium calliandrae TaxID=1312182 RepID=A0ABT7KCK0_9HYPH|nr:hypothetical protein [Rhizobium calliandrae]MDL2405917.1 hypothetical protein [Rhizobium calliandrae]